MYHCALAGDRDRLVEVCAPSAYIHGIYNNTYYTSVYFRPLLMNEWHILFHCVEPVISFMRSTFVPEY